MRQKLHRSQTLRLVFHRIIHYPSTLLKLGSAPMAKNFGLGCPKYLDRSQLSGVPAGPREFRAELVVHGAGRVADLSDLNLEVANVQADLQGVKINEFLQSVSNRNVYAAGDAADLGMPKLTPVASYSGVIAAANLLKKDKRRIANVPVPTATFTVPPLATVGMNEDDAKTRRLRYRVHHEDTSDWYSSKRVAEPCSAFKVLIDKDTDQILGAHLLGPEADELINVFSLAMQANVPAATLRDSIYAYPTHASDVSYML